LALRPDGYADDQEEGEEVSLTFFLCMHSSLCGLLS
jgi:hypothetical protein